MLCNTEQLILNKLLGVISQKTEPFIITPVEVYHVTLSAQYPPYLNQRNAHFSHNFPLEI
jgi:hypothetical protein